MSVPVIHLRGVSKAYRFFRLENVSLELAPGEIMGFVGPNGAGKSTTLRILLGLVAADAGEVRVLGQPMPERQAEAKRDVGYVSDDMKLFPNATIGWHMQFVASLYPAWDADYAASLLKRFGLQPAQLAKQLSRGEQTKALLLLALARRPRLLILDEPTTGLDPVARHEVLTEFLDVLQDEGRSILFSSHNTVDVERISDQITFIDRGRIVDSGDKESFLDRWRRVQLNMNGARELPQAPDVVDVSANGQVATVTTRNYTPELHLIYEQVGATVHTVQRMTLEEIFVANVMRSRKEHAT
jgi:ABC-2 type transport system ATP-binding protein